MKKFKFKSIRSLLIFWFLIVSLLPLFVGTTITYINDSEYIRDETKTRFKIIRDLKVQKINNWLNERLLDLKTIVEDFDVRSLEDILNKAERSKDESEKMKKVRNSLLAFKEVYTAYSELFLISSKTGNIELSTTPSYEFRNKSNDQYYLGPLKSRKYYIKDMYHSETTGKIEMTFSIPIYCKAHDPAHLTSILVARINIKNSIYPILSDYKGLGETGEIIAINRDGFVLNELKGNKNAPLNLKMYAVPILKAAQGETGIIETTSYNKKRALAAYTYIPRTKWGFIIKQDLDEIYKPINLLYKKFAVLSSVFTLLIVFFVFWLSKTLTNPLRRIASTTKKIRDGDYSIRNIIQSKNEISDLAISINEMADSIESRDTIQKNITNISKSIIRQRSIKEFGSGLLKILMKITRANMSVFYILNELNSEFEYLTSFGAKTELLKPINAINPEGEVGNAILEKNIFYMQDIPEDTIFKYKTTAGEAIPKEIITIPILIDNIVVAIISLVTIKCFSEESFNTIQDFWISLNTSYSNLISNERTRILAENLSRINFKLESQTEDLKNQSEELQLQRDELQNSSIAIREKNIELENQKNQIKDANKLKNEFLSNTSHELKTPLNSILTLTKVLMIQAKDKLDNDEYNYLTIINRNGADLLEMINGLLELSKIEEGKLDLNIDEFSIKSTIEEICENLEPIAREKGIEILPDLPDELPTMISDEIHVHRILQNVINNGVKFTVKGNVSISVFKKLNNIHIKINDTGIGIKENDLPFIFDEFRQVDGSTTRKFEGTGLGLTIAKKAAIILGGDILVESVYKEGTSFEIILPLIFNGENNGKNTDNR